VSYVRRNGQWVDKSTGEPMEVPERNDICIPRVRSDITAYVSPITGQMIDGRAAQREDLKRSGCRLQDPSEHTVHTCRTEKWARRLGKDVEDVSEKRL
jgi:hypothetical protein